MSLDIWFNPRWILIVTLSTPIAGLLAAEITPEDRTYYVGSTLILEGDSKGDNHQWYRGTDAVTNNWRIDGAQTPVLRIVDALETDSGIYTLKSLMTIWQTNVTSSTEITNLPSLDGCAATNSTIVTIIKENETNSLTIILQTNSLPLPGCSQTNYVTFFQTNLITGTDTEMTNSVFLVQVVPRPTPPHITNFFLLTGPNSVTFTVEATGTPPPSYQWYWQGNAILGATESTLSFSPAETTANAGYYSVIVQNSVGVDFSPPPGLLFIKATAAGTYKGIFCDDENPIPETSGSFQYTLSGSKRTFSGKVLIGKTMCRFSGTLSEGHDAVVETLQTVNGTPLTLQLQLITTNNLPGVIGTVSSDSWSVPLRGYRTGYSSRDLAPQAGKYTLALQDVNTNLVRTVPDGCSVAAITVTKEGGVVMKGLAADGTKFTCSSSLARSGHWPLYASLYKNQGCMVGWLQLTNTTDNAIQGESLHWRKNAVLGAASYPDGFFSSLQAVGSRFSTAPNLFPWPPSPVVNVLPFTEAVASLAAGDMFSPDLFSPDGLAVWTFIKVSIPEPNKFVAEKSAERLRLSVSRSNGTISGSFTHPMTGQRVPLRGIVLQEQQSALGYFLSRNCSGFFALTPPGTAQ